MHSIVQERLTHLTRRHLFKTAGAGLGAAALSSLLTKDAPLFANESAPAEKSAAGGLPELPHFAPKAKRAIYLFMAGAPTQIDMLDHKPKLVDLFDQDLPESVRNGQRLTTMTSGQARFPLAPSKFKFQQYGANGLYVSELLPHTGKMIDDLAVVRSVHTEAINHDPAITYICTGNQLPGRASLGAWLGYGLGSLNEDLPTFVVMTPTWSAKKDPQALYNRLWGAGFLPSKHQGVALRRTGEPVLYLNDPQGVDRDDRRRMLDALGKLNDQALETYGDPETRARIAQYEMAFRMQASVPDLLDISKEPQHVLDLYGPEVSTPGTFAYSCLMARRMAERDVRFVQIFHRGWDMHSDIAGELPANCRDIDQPSYGLIQDLKQRGLLDDTLVAWSGEFGRTTYCQGALTKENYGRDHHPRCFTAWLAGGGIKPGVVHGETDDFSYNVAKDPVHIADLNATILHCLGIDHRRLSYRYQGLDVRLTGVEERNPVKEILL